MRYIDRAGHLQAGLTIQIDSYSDALFPSVSSFLPLFLSLFRQYILSPFFLRCNIAPSSFSYETEPYLPFSYCLHVYHSLFPFLLFLYLSLFLYRRKGNRGNKAIRLWCSVQPRLSISIYPMQSLPTWNCVQVYQAFQRCGGWNFDWIFPKCRMCQ